MLALLDSSGVEEFMALYLAAVQAEVRGTAPVLRTDSTAVAWARRTIMSSLPPEGRKIFSNEVNPSTRFVAVDRCAVKRTVVGRILALPESQQPDYAQAVAIWLAVRHDETM